MRINLSSKLNVATFFVLYFALTHSQDTCLSSCKAANQHCMAQCYNSIFYIFCQRLLRCGETLRECQSACESAQDQSEPSDTQSQPSVDQPSPSSPVESDPAASRSLTCGRRGNIDDGFRIIGGTESSDCEFPWMVFVYKDVSKTMCGGSIIDRSHILTAAHCVTSHDGRRSFVTPANRFVILSGNSKVFSSEGFINRLAKVNHASKVIRHPNYNPNNLGNDIAIIKLEQPLDWDNCHSPVCLPDGKTAPRNGGHCIVSGWGRMSNGGSATGRLRWTDVDVVSCGLYFRSEREAFCAGGNHHDTCNGDSGGPLACRQSGSEGYIQYGITSAGIKDRCGTTPGLYTDVTKYVSWINGVLGK